jgi:hypothetical protein
MLNEIRIRTVNIQIINTNPHCRIYSSRKIIGTGYCHWEKTKGNSIDPENKPAVIQLLGDLDGIESLLLHAPYEVWITKGKAFDWNELEDKIIDILALGDVNDNS